MSPPLYHQLTPLCADQHRQLGLLPASDVAFAREATAIPVGVSEFAAIGRHLPIVFAGSGVLSPVVITGLRPGENLLVDGAGRWLGGVHVPGWLRRYPFLLAWPDGAGADPVLAVDMACSRISDSAPARQRLFDDSGEAAALAREAAAMCAGAHDEEQRTLAFVQALQEEKLLVPGRREYAFPGGATRTVDGFLTIDAAALRRLPDAVATRWFRSGLLDAALMQTLSQQCWPLLGELLLARVGRAAQGEAA
ncbi:SapC family protein [Camelimonas abortus]|uniref:SapC family protein n=1 Tax=Camelimonas abortus TaxID=1017184 RepID=A0ABV7LAE2_9HYPH